MSAQLTVQDNVTEPTGRACSTCCAYAHGHCSNHVAWSHAGGPYEEPWPTDCCPDHKTHDEDRREDAAVYRFRSRLGVQPALGASE